MEKNAIVLFDYEPSEHDDLRLVKGKKIKVIQVDTENEGWSLGKNKDGVKGIYPSNYVSIQDDGPPAPPRPKRRSVKAPTESDLEVEEKRSVVVEDNISDSTFVVLDSWDLGVPADSYVLGQKTPIWKYPSFIDLVADPYVDGKRIDEKTQWDFKNVSIMDSLSKSIKFFSKLCDILCRSPHVEKPWKKIIWDLKMRVLRHH